MTPVRVCMCVLNPAITDERVMREASALAEAGYDVTVVDIEHDSGRPRTETARGVKLRHALLPDRWKRHYSPARGAGWMAFKLLRMLYATWLVVMTPADIYHAHDITALPACYLAALARRRKLVFDAHELPLVQPHIVKRRLIHSIAGRLFRFLMRRCDAAITVSPPLVDVMRKMYGGPQAWVIRNVPLYQAPVRSDRLRERLNLPVGTRIALYQGGIQANRTLDILVRAAHYLDPNTVIVMMGDGPQTAELVSMIAAEDVSDRVKMLPAVPYRELLSWTASADLGLLLFRPDYSLSIKYSLPNKLFEYLMAGLPVLTSEMDAIVDVVRTLEVGEVIRTWSPEAIGRGISTALSDARWRESRRDAALVAARDRYCWEVEKSRLVDLYKCMMNDKQGSLSERHPFEAPDSLTRAH
ncbi:MAG TPA: glycosyltransferase family 4 protein [Ktedonobacterales bacterium]